MKKIILMSIVTIIALSGCGQKNTLEIYDTMQTKSTMMPEPTVVQKDIPERNTIIPEPTETPTIELATLLENHTYESELNMIVTEDIAGNLTYNGDGVEIVEEKFSKYRRTYIRSNKFSIYGIKIGMSREELANIITVNLTDFFHDGEYGSDLYYANAKDNTLIFTIVDDKIFKIQFWEPPIDTETFGEEGDSGIDYSDDIYENAGYLACFNSRGDAIENKIYWMDLPQNIYNDSDFSKVSEDIEQKLIKDAVDEFRWFYEDAFDKYSDYTINFIACAHSESTNFYYVTFDIHGRVANVVDVYRCELKMFKMNGNNHYASSSISKYYVLSYEQ